MGLARQTVYRWLRTSEAPHMDYLKRLAVSLAGDDLHLAARILCDLWDDATLLPDVSAARNIIVASSSDPEERAQLVYRSFFAPEK
jgi:hypothetical protein